MTLDPNIAHTVHVRATRVMGAALAESDNIGDVVRAVVDDILASFQPAPCVRTHTPPFDFAQCETHDTTFPLGDTCKFDGREMWEVYDEEAQEQRGRAVRAEMRLDRVRELPYASDDGSEYEHTHPAEGGEPECPACWAADIRRAIGDNQ